jgi:hypothetical protein
MDTIIENNGEIAVVRGHYTPLAAGRTDLLFEPEIGMLWQIPRKEFGFTREAFLEAYPVGKHITILVPCPFAHNLLTPHAQ